MLLTEVKDWLKEVFPVAEHFYCGKLDNKKEKSIGVYQRRPSGNYNIPLGGKENKSYEEKDVSVLVHWTKYSGETEEAAFSLFEQIRDAMDIVIGGHRVFFIRLEVPEPIDVGTDDNGVYERVIWLKIFYERQG